MSKRSLFLLNAIFLLAFVHLTFSQGEFPTVFNSLLRKPVSSQNGQSVCGAAGSESYCAFSSGSTASFLPNCLTAVCDNSCPNGEAAPSREDLLALAGLLARGESRPGSLEPSVPFSSATEASVAFSGAFVDGFSFAVWYRQGFRSTGTLISKSTGSSTIFAVQANDSAVTLVHENAQGMEVVRVSSGLSLPLNTWHHLAVTVYKEDFALFINGILSDAYSIGNVLQDAGGTIDLGVRATGGDRFIGNMQDAYYYQQAITERDVQRLADVAVTYVHSSPNCRCPASRPRVDPVDQSRCIQYPNGGLIARGTARRISENARPLGNMNDGNFGTIWVSEIGNRDAQATINMGSNPFEVLFVLFRFDSPPARAFALEKSVDNGVTFTPFQYFSDDCVTYFGLPDNGDLTTPSSVNCITTGIRQQPLGSIIFRPIDPSRRPGSYNENAELREFIRATHLRLRFVDFFNTTLVGSQHLYYSLLEVVTSSRCDCSGHASRCDASPENYQCQCLHNTAGDHCNQCQPLYNNKPWQRGTSTGSNACQLCQCNGHASSCRYDASVDPTPESSSAGGGGVCEDCRDRTEGGNCERCQRLYFRPLDRVPSDADACQECACNLTGTADDGDCVKDSTVSGSLAGQCSCKQNVRGLKCDVCRSGFFNLSASNSLGCQVCDCSLPGTLDPALSCDAESGQCTCKQNAVGLLCDRCASGFTNLTALNPEGCSPCGCDPRGSVDGSCDPHTGVCTCKTGVTGDKCDTCAEGFFGFNSNGCQTCSCSSVGSDNSNCNSVSGQCSCRPGFTGLSCAECMDGFFSFETGCPACGCNTAGTVNGSQSCDASSGACNCKPNVLGPRCDQCAGGTALLNASNPDGCSVCPCVIANTNASASSELCDRVTSQCLCNAGATGLLCEACLGGHYLTGGGCVACRCNAGTSVDNECDASTAQCTCAHQGIGGIFCEQCRPGFFQFPQCQQCGCDERGSMSVACDSTDGSCSCKEFVRGDRCDQCTEGFFSLEASNPSGCSAAPDELGPPSAQMTDATTVQLTWLPPEKPNGEILYYTVARNGTGVGNVTERAFNDSGLEPFTTYSYTVTAVNRVGSTTSESVIVRTSEGTPEGISAPSVQTVDANNLLVAWTPPTEPNGVVVSYALYVIGAGGMGVSPPNRVHLGNGETFSTTVSNLDPFTVYEILVEACTSGGCGRGPSTRQTTAESAPDFQSPPNATALTFSSVVLVWLPPSRPNGIVTSYTVHQRSTPFVGNGQPVANLTVAGSQLSVVVSNLQPFTEYEFAVESYTSAGGTVSTWTRVRTGETVPAGVQAPTVTTLSSTSLRINWTRPLAPHGTITSYTVFVLQPFQMIVTQSPIEGSYVLDGLSAFTDHTFLLEVCTSAGCTNSSEVTQATMDAVPTGQGEVRVGEITQEGVSLVWDPPTSPNGVIQDYTVDRRTAALTAGDQIYETGVTFAGITFARFSRSFSSSVSTSASLWFKTFDTDATLLYGSEQSGEDFVAIDLIGGQPVFRYDCGSGSVSIPPNTTVTFNDGNWHYLEVSRREQSGTIRVDENYSGTGLSPGQDRVIAAFSSLFVGSRQDLAQSGSVTFAGSLRSVMYGNEILDLSQRDPVDEPPLAITTDGALVNADNAIHFQGGSWLSTTSVFAAANPVQAFALTVEFRTTDSNGVLFYAWGDSQSMELSLSNGSPVLILRQNESILQSTSLDSVCDGGWNSLSIVMTPGRIRTVVTLSDNSFSLLQPDILAASVTLDRSTYFGATPGKMRTLGMAIRKVEFGGVELDVRSFAASSRLVNFAWSPSGGSPPQCDVERVVYTVGGTSVLDNRTEPFQTYMYRVGSRNNAGTSLSPWTALRTLEGAPQGVMQVVVAATDNTSISLTWTPPTRPNGVILAYSIAATPERPTWGEPSQLTTNEAVRAFITDFSNGLSVSLEGLEPATVYSIVLAVNTSGGSTSGTPVQANTTDGVPTGVRTPALSSSTATRLFLSWQTPDRPNGIVTGYEVLVDGTRRSSVSGTSVAVSDLMPNTNYTVAVRACTSAGCAESGSAVFATLPDIPTGQAAPSLTVLGSTAIEAVWQPPTQPNGDIIEYRLLILSGPELSRVEVVFNGTELSYIVTGLQPGTTYVFAVESFNIGGSSRSNTFSARTNEDVPSGIAAPSLIDVNSTALSLGWAEPSQPNGIINRYVLLMEVGNLTEIFTGLATEFVVSGLQPFTTYTLVLQACTRCAASCCGSSEPAMYTTAEAAPVGVSPPNIVTVTPTSVTFEISPVDLPNGVVTYTVYTRGMFGSSSENETATSGSSDTGELTRVVYQDSAAGVAMYSGLLPFTTYELYLTVSNTAGEITSASVFTRTNESLPLGLAAPSVELTEPTSLRVTWNPPSQPNGNITHYDIVLRSSEAEIVNVRHTNVANLVRLIESLVPFVTYSVTVSAYNGAGSVTSEAVNVTTGEIAPVDFDTPVIRELTNSSFIVYWDPPGFPNGVLLSYQVSLNGTAQDLIQPNLTRYAITELGPFTTHEVFVTVCNAAGCADSSPTLATTLEGFAVGVPAPSLVTTASGEVMLTWSPPEQPNGVILRYHVERALSLSGTPERLGNTTGVEFLDSRAVPFTQYWYRVVAVNGAGESVGLFSNITTPEAAPTAVDRPTVAPLTATSQRVGWAAPSEPNGLVVQFVLKRFVSTLNSSSAVTVATLEASVFNYTDMNLSPHTNYSYTITACNTGGCTESQPGQGLTGQDLPDGLADLTGFAVNSTAISLTWDSPSQPNGIVTQYHLYREPAISGLLGRVLLFSGQETTFTDTELRPYTFYTYSYEVGNDAGSVASNASAPVRTLAAPPTSGPSLAAEALNSTTILARWAPPASEDIRGPLLQYTLTAAADGSVISLNVSADIVVYRFVGLTPGTVYAVVVSLCNGAGTADSNLVEVVTAEGIPAGVLQPSVGILSPTSVNVSWVLPMYPNGDINLYSVYISSTNVHNSTTVGSVQVDGLLPFTMYTARIEACTQFGCGVSQLTRFMTPEDAPFGLATPTLTITGLSSTSISWIPPVQPNGNITEYRLYRRATVACDGETDGCSYVECPISQSALCGTQCYSSVQSVCCEGVLHNLVEGFACCGTNYLPSNSSVGQVCCGGSLHATRPNHQCCGGQYLHVPLGSVCCETGSGMPRIGMGSACCGGSPYTESQDVVCCGSTVETNHVTRMCCGGQMISTTSLECCEGIPHALQSGRSCCGQQYVQSDTSLCCTVDGGVARAYAYNSAEEKVAAGEQCCDGSRIPGSSSCCNEMGYDSSVSVCADRPSTAAVVTSRCGSGTTCPLSQEPSSFCNRCDFNTDTAVCGVYSPPPSMPTSGAVSSGGDDGVCYGETELVFTGLALQFQDSGLSPYSEYSYRVVAVNTVGNVSSGFVTNTTDQGAPASVDPPLLAVQSFSAIFIHWSLPSVLNGELASVRLYRNGTEVFSTPSPALSYLDGNLTAFTSFSYRLEFCTAGGCTASPTTAASTAPDTPTGLADPVASPNPALSSVLISWSPPTYPNGVILRYELRESASLGVVFNGTGFEVTVGGLASFTTYSFVLTACNEVGCVSSNAVLVQTPAVPPTFVDPVTINILSSRSIDISWTPPTSPNGVILGYILRRDDVVIFNGTGLMYRDAGLTPSTQYSYTVEAYNGGGGRESERVIVHTPQDSPEGLQPPDLQVLSAVAIRATWTAPSQPNGRITSYSIVIDNVATELGNATFEHTASGLTPYSVYRFRIEACTASGCSRSTEVSEQTLEAPPVNVSAPSLVALGPSVVEVSWQQPSAPNGVITSYEVTRLSGDSPIPSLQHFGDATVLTFNDITVEPFTTYQYRLRASNMAGSGFSPYSTIQTPEDVPSGLRQPIVSSILSTSAVITWSSPDRPNGILLRYDVYLRLSVDPVTLGPGVPQLVFAAPANVTMFQLTSVLPATAYEVRVVAVNGAGREESVWVAFETRQDAPDNLQPIRVVGRPVAGTALMLEWDAPLSPNGVITSYAVHMDGVERHRALPRSATVTGLQPFTAYSLRLEACTSAGCTQGEPRSETTAEVSPAGQQPPSVTVLSSRSVSVTWQAPLIPNGVILQFEVLRRRIAVGGSGGDNEALVVFSKANVAPLGYNDTGLTPFTSYEYAVRVTNSAGSDTSVFIQVRTSSDAPMGFAAPVLSAVSSTSILVSWSEPAQPHGTITGYTVVRNDSLRVPVLSLSYTDTPLTPFTVYAYTVEVCTDAGCTESAASIERTSEAVPTGLSPPLSAPLTSSSITVAWSAPTAPNGVLTSYRITIQPDGIQVERTDLVSLIVNVADLSPFTDYSVSLVACNSAGCSDAVSTTVRTLEDVPMILTAPSLTTLSSTSVQASWQTPARPNGQILRYELRRNGTLVSSSTSLSYIDNNLGPSTLYAYDLQAYTVAGGSNRSSPSFIRTQQDTPTGVLPPVLTPLSSSTIRAVWTTPQMPNGDITEYRLFRNDSEVFRGQSFEHNSTALLPYALYEFYLTACTTTCGSSIRVTSRTREAPPANVQRPALTALPNVTVLVMWTPPFAPNGIITSYKVARTSPPSAVIAVIFTGDALMYLDTEVQPAREYEYSVIAANSAGEAASQFSSVTTAEAVPADVLPPLAGTITATSITLFIRSPTSPNGVITLYRVFRNGVMLAEVAPNSSGSTTSHNVVSLVPFTAYSFFVEACNSAGCGRSSAVVFTTSEAPPTSLAPPTAFATGPRSVYVNWTAPAQPNGQITRYTLWYRTACPQPVPLQICTPGLLMLAGPVDSSLVRTLGSLTGSASHPLPYTAFEFVVQAENSAGAVNSSFSDPVQTGTDDPEVIGSLLSEVSGTNVTLHWNETFRLNGPLRFYQVTRNNLVAAEPVGTTVTLSNQPTNTPLMYRVMAITGAGNALSPVVTVTIPDVVVSMGTTLPTASPSPSAVPTTTSTPPPVLSAAIVVVIVLGGCVVCIVLMCIVVIVCMWALAKRTKKSKQDPNDTFTHQRLYDNEMAEFHPVPLKLQEDPRHSGSTWSEPEDPYLEVQRNKGFASYSPPDAEKKYYRDLNARDSYGTQISNYSNPKAYQHMKEDSSDDFYEDGEPFTCTLADTRI